MAASPRSPSATATRSWRGPAPDPPRQRGRLMRRAPTRSASMADDVVLSSLRRREDGWLEARLVNLALEPRRAVLHGGLHEAREADLRGIPGPALALAADGSLAFAARRGRDPHVPAAPSRDRRSADADVLDAAGPRQHG